MRGLVAVVLLAGCDALFHVDYITPPTPDAPTDASTGGPITYVQSSSSITKTTGGAVTVPFNMPEQAGALNVVVIGFDASGTISSVTDDHPFGYTLTEAARMTGTIAEAIYFAPNVPAGANRITVMFDIDLSPEVRIVEYRGVATANVLDAASGMVGNGTALDSGPITTIHDHDLLVAGTTVGGQTIMPGVGYTQRVVTTPNGGIVEDREVSAAGRYSATATQDAPKTWIIQIAAFKGK